MAKTNSKKVMLADTLGRTVAEIVSEKTKEYLNDGCVLLDFDEASTEGLFKVYYLKILIQNMVFVLSL